MVIDLRSDIISRPTQEMIEAMSKAATTNFSFGFREDAVQSRLEELAAEMLGKEDALFFPTATMCNQTAIHIFCSAGSEFIAESESHCIFAESGAPAALSGVMPRPIKGEMGFVKPREIEAVINSGNEQRPRTSLIVIENTHNRAGGTVISASQMKETYDVAKQRSIPIHLDGARIFNAAVYLKVPVSNLTKYADSVTISLNKGLSAPLGALLTGSKSFIREAERVRVMFGGGWRPTSILAAAGIVALKKMIERLAEDHKNTRKLAEGLASIGQISIDLERVQTNMIYAKINHPSLVLKEIIDRLGRSGILVGLSGPYSIRMVLHREIGEKEVNEVIRVFQEIMRE